MKKISEPEMLHRMAAYCSTAERCIYDVEKKLSSTELPEEAKSRIIEKLVKEKFLSETRYANSFVKDKLRFNRWGKIKISYELQKKNIPPAIRTEALAQIDEEEYHSVLYFLLKEKKRSVKGKDEYDIFNKLLRFGAGRGFESRELIPCLKKLFNGENYADDME